MDREQKSKIKVFTLAQANQTLPLVRRIVEDIVRLHDEASDSRREADRCTEQGKTLQADEARGRLQDLVIDLTSFIAELEGLGCQLKDTAQGLVDFPARLDDRVVLLCWRRGEPEIRYWHEIEGGFAGRQPVQGVFA